MGEGAVCAPPEDGCAIAPKLSGEGNDRAQQRNVKTHAKMRLPLLSSNYFTTFAHTNQHSNRSVSVLKPASYIEKFPYTYNIYVE